MAEETIGQCSESIDNTRSYLQVRYHHLHEKENGDKRYIDRFDSGSITFEYRVCGEHGISSLG